MNEPNLLIRNLDTLPFPAWDLLPDLTKFYKPLNSDFKAVRFLAGLLQNKKAK